MTKVVFETATFADAIRKADKIAPNRGNAFDKSAGIVIEVDPLSPSPIVIRATNLDIYSMEWVDALEVSGEKTSWRVPSQLFAQVMTSLPIGSGTTVTIEEVKTDNGHSHLLLVSGRTKAKFNLMMMEHYPMWSVFDPDTLVSINDFAGKITQVEWAAAQTSADVQLCGIHLDGEKCVATDRYRLATSDLKIPDLDKGITIPAGILGMVLKQTGEVSIAVTPEQLLIMPDEHTQIRTILYGTEYPKVERLMIRERPDTITVKKTALLEIMKRAANFAGADRYPTLRCFFGKEEIAVMMTNAEVGLLGDVIDIPGYGKHDRVEIRFTPKNIIEAITMSPNEEITIGYDHENPEKIMYINGGSGYETWIVPRKATDPKPT